MKNLCKYFSGWVKSKHPASKSAKGTILSLLLAACTAFTACNNDESSLPTAGNQLQLSFGINALESRAIFEDTELPIGAKVGVTLDDGIATDYDTYSSLFYTASADDDKQVWTGSKSVTLTSTIGSLYAYWPYSDAVEISALPVDMTAHDQTDWLYATPVTDVNEDNSEINVTLYHAGANINVIVNKGTYKGDGNISNITVQSDGLALGGTFNAAQPEPAYIAFSGEGDALVRNVSTTAGGAATDIMVVPTGTSAAITFLLTIDGIQFTAKSAAVQLAMGYSYQYTLTLSDISTYMTVSAFSVTPWNKINKESLELIEVKVDPYKDWVKATYNVTSTSSATTILSKSSELNLNNVKNMVVDGVEMSPQRTYTFNSTGKQNVYFKFTNETNICMRAFYENKDLTDIYIPEGITGITDYAFSGCSSLETIYIPSTLTSLSGGYTFATACKSLKSIVVHKNNPVFDSRDNCNAIIHTSSKTIILGCSNTKLPSSVQYIGNNAFLDRINLKEMFDLSNIKTIGINAFSGCTGLAEINIPSNIESIDVQAFQNCTGLKSVSISAPFNSLGNYLFKNCSSLKDVVLPETITSIGQYCFSNCKSLEVVDWLPDGLKNIKSYAFEECSSLKEIHLGSYLQTLGSGVFTNCTSLLKIVSLSKNVITASEPAYGTLYGGIIIVPSGVSDNYSSLMQNNSNSYFGYKKWIIIEEGNYKLENGIYYSNDMKEVLTSEYDLTGTATISSGAVSINPYAFYNRKLITNVNFPSTLSNIDAYAFYGCSGLSDKLTISENCNTIAENAFNECNNITQVDLRNVSSMGNNAFSYCSKLTQVNWSTNLQSIPNGAFRGCGFTEFEVPSNITNIGDNAFSGCSKITNLIIGDGMLTIGNHAFSGCTNMKNVDLGTTVQTIGNNAFYGCTGLTGELSIPNSVTLIGSSAFDGCNNISKVIIGNGVQTIKQKAFHNCQGLVDITLGSNVESIEHLALAQGYNLYKITSLAMTAPSIVAYSIAHLKSGGTLYVPKGATGYEAWMTSESGYPGAYSWSKKEMTE